MSERSTGKAFIDQYEVPVQLPQDNVGIQNDEGPGKSNHIQFLIRQLKIPDGLSNAPK
jgi:hypothetical protein